MSAAPLGEPPAVLANDRSLPVSGVNPSELVRVSRFVTGEPHFGASGANRFDAPGCVGGTPEYRTCYFGSGLDVAIAESLLHDAIPIDGRFLIASSTLRQRYVHYFDGNPLRLLDLTGALLKRLDGHADLAGTGDYPVTQRWALAVFKNPLRFDGFIYMSRHLNTGRAVVLFDRAAARLKHLSVITVLCDAPGFVEAAKAFFITPA